MSAEAATFRLNPDNIGMIRDRAFFEKNGFTLEAEATPKCNFKCPYCENRDDGTDPGPDLDLSELLAFAERSFPVGKLTVLLNGGEPTLNPGLEEFCVRAAARPDTRVILYTNASAEPALYRRLVSTGVDVLATFHGVPDEAPAFADRLAECGISEPPLIPLTKTNIDRADDLVAAFSRIQTVVLETERISPADVAKMSKLDPQTAVQSVILYKSKRDIPVRKMCGRKYVYVDGNGDVCRCILTLQSAKIGNIYNGYIFDGGDPFECRCRRCIYEL